MLSKLREDLTIHSQRYVEELLGPEKIEPRPFSKLDYLIVPHQFSFRNGCISNDLLLFTQYYISKVNCLMSKLIQTLSSVMRNIQMLK